MKIFVMSKAHMFKTRHVLNIPTWKKVLISFESFRKVKNDHVKRYFDHDGVHFTCFKPEKILCPCDVINET